MKVCIGYQVVSGPWGGGNGFFAGLIAALQTRGHSVVNNLTDRDIDIILITDPRYGRKNRAIPFSYKQAKKYVNRVNSECLIVHRINECDERKNTRDMNNKLKSCNEVADFTVFVGSWLKMLDLWGGSEKMPSRVILNGSDSNIFNSSGFQPWNGKGPLRLVTHHWGGNWMKGFDVYDQIDKMLGTERWSDRIEFSYIGNLPKGYKFQNAKHIPPLSGEKLASALKNNHAYVTGSVNEPGGNHQNEGIQCGLPIMYLESGCMPEYLAGYGFGYNHPKEFEASLDAFISDYNYWKEQAQGYPNSLERTCEEWLGLFEELLTRKAEFMQMRLSRGQTGIKRLFGLWGK
ncbi:MULTISPECIES: glycosyltransferase [Thalassospira]|uniref:Glycosyltransferase family 1 protein n=1 Tax=Thalassospira profundimaris TaxID=502049 RepID=A0A367VJS4_9PROT|nr:MULTISPECIES: glycosyltransferase [Thalassospira]KZB70923.1 hypothetical protein AUQ43_08730 [Thalassospira sp. MCCC 1A01148]MBR9899358.1 glycosyltransferase [Rhodospirillales bacterium]RCK25433.1 hypothetical protein TH6_02125 [Thalassospira profundimaris]